MDSSTESPNKVQSDINPTKDTKSWFPRRLSIEEGGIERVTDEERHQNTTKFWNATTFWYISIYFFQFMNVWTDVRRMMV
jgi:hypothetical protein